MATGILEVKLGSAVNMTDRRLRLLLDLTRRRCCQARNAAITHWLLWRRSHPEWVPGAHYDAPPRKINRPAGNGDGEKSEPPKDPPYAPRAFMSRELYRVAVAAVPLLNTNVASSCVQEVNARLRANTPYDHDGPARFMWEAILNSEVSLPTWRGGRIPMPRSGAVLTYTDDQCHIRFPLLSRQSGYKIVSPTVRLLASDLTAGRRQILRRLADGDLRMADSQIVERKGQWFVQFCYDMPEGAQAFSPERKLILLPTSRDAKRPFVARWVNLMGEQRHWDVGDGLPLVAEYRRVVARRRALRSRYSDGCGSGHGRVRWYRTIRPMSRYVRDMCSRFVKHTVADIVALATREQCGTIVYREPTKPVRERVWFTDAQRDVPMNWVDFESRLAHKCQVVGLEYRKERIGMAEWKDANGIGTTLTATSATSQST